MVLKTSTERGVSVCLRLLVFVHVCLHSFPFACACMCQCLSACVCVCSHLLTPAFVAPSSVCHRAPKMFPCAGRSYRKERVDALMAAVTTTLYCRLAQSILHKDCMLAIL